jgi:hypothetical protein
MQATAAEVSDYRYGCCNNDNVVSEDKSQWPTQDIAVAHAERAFLHAGRSASTHLSVCLSACLLMLAEVHALLINTSAFHSKYLAVLEAKLQVVCKRKLDEAVTSKALLQASEHVRVIRNTEYSFVQKD